MKSATDTHTKPYFAAAIVFSLLLLGFGVEVRSLHLADKMGPAFIPAFTSFALLLAPLWFFGLGIADDLRQALRSKISRTLAPALLVLPYLLFAIPLHDFHVKLALALALLPVGLEALLQSAHDKQTLLWQDVVVLTMLALTLELHLLSSAWPQAGLGSLPKLYLADVALYLYLISRRIQGMGYSFLPRASAFFIGIREWLFFAPIAFGLGFALHFIRFFPRVHSVGHIIAGVLVTFLLTAVPEEIFFRGILQNLLEHRLGRDWALAIASVLFGISHFHKGAAFNWRYVILATFAGVFYGRAWRVKRQLLASAVTHTTVDVVWSLWFR